MTESISTLKQGDCLNNDELCSVFGCSPQGGMRRAYETNSLVIVSNHLKSLYDDRWVDDIFHYTGMGANGDQSLAFHQNKTLHESSTNGVNVYLFEVFKKLEYTFIGEVELAGSAYTEKQLDESKTLRTVWVFPLRLKHGGVPIIPEKLIENVLLQRQKKAQKLSDEELKLYAMNSVQKTGKRTTTTKHFERNVWISENSKRWAKGECQLCNQPAPFIDELGNPYLESHHVEWLSRGGEDSVANTVAVCPNCHRKLHVLDTEGDVIKLRKAIESYLGSDL